MSLIIIHLSFFEQMHDVTVTSHDLIFFYFVVVVELLFFLANGKWQQTFQCRTCLSEDLKYMDLNKENKTYWLRCQREHKLFIQYSKKLRVWLPWQQ